MSWVKVYMGNVGKVFGVKSTYLESIEVFSGRSGFLEFWRLSFRCGYFFWGGGVFEGFLKGDLYG